MFRFVRSLVKSTLQRTGVRSWIASRGTAPHLPQAEVPDATSQPKIIQELAKASKIGSPTRLPPPKENQLPPSAPSCTVVYDGSCPVCSLAVKTARINGAQLVNARDGANETVKELEKNGFNLDKGMAIVLPNGEVRYGADAVTEMGNKAASGPVKYLLNLGVSERCYPFFRGIRNLLVPEPIEEQRARETSKAKDAADDHNLIRKSPSK